MIGVGIGVLLTVAARRLYGRIPLVCDNCFDPVEPDWHVCQHCGADLDDPTRAPHTPGWRL
jgi:rRNA maturation endonuclease Nob1